MPDGFYLRFRGRAVGPYPLAQTQLLAFRGQLSRHSEVSTDGHTWTPASAFPEIFERPADASTELQSTEQTAYQPGPADHTSQPIGNDQHLSKYGPAEAVADWHYILRNQQLGPVSDAFILALLRAGELNSRTLVWRDGMSAWATVEQVPEFRTLAEVCGPPPLPHRSTPHRGPGRCHRCGEVLYHSGTLCTRCSLNAD